MVNSLLSFSIIFPISAAILSLVVKKELQRKILVCFSCFIIVADSISILLYSRLPGVYSFIGSPSIIDLALKIGDFLLLFYVLWISHETGEWKIGLFSLLQILPLAYFELFILKEGAVPAFFVDELSILMNLIISVVGSLIAIFALGYMKRHEELHKVLPSRQPRFFAIILMFLGAMNGLVLSNNLMAVYFFWEVTSLCSFLLISHDNTKQAVQNGARALWMNMMGGVAFILGIIYLYSHYHILSLEQLLKIQGGGYIMGCVVLLSIAAFTKSAQMPFESWLLGAMVAPTPVSGLLHSSTMVKAGIYLMLRISPLMKGTFFANVIAIYGVYTFISAAVLALSQSNAKKILAYSTISNLGFMVSSIGIDTPSAIAAAMMLLIFHAVSKALLFLCVGTIEQNIGSRDIEDMRGLISRMPMTALVTIVGILTLMIAPFGMLLSKWLALEAASREFPVSVMMAAGSAVSMIFYSRWMGNLLSTTKMSSIDKIMHDRENIPMSMRLVLESLATLSIVLSMFVMRIFNIFVEPQMNNMHMNLSIRAAGGYISNGGIGGFAIYPVFIIMILSALISAFALKNAPMVHSTPYVCGLEYRESRFEVKNYYLAGLLNEKKVKGFMDMVSVLLIIVLAGGLVL